MPLERTSGCEFCDALQHALPDDAVGDTAEGSMVLQLAYRPTHPLHASLSIPCCAIVLHKILSPLNTNRQLWITLTERKIHNVSAGGALTYDAGHVMKWRAWIRECETTHGKCRTSAYTTPLPTRVIDVSNGIEPPRLVQWKCVGALCVALLHVWGAQHTLRTTLSSYHTHLHGIP